MTPPDFAVPISGMGGSGAPQPDQQHDPGQTKTQLQQQPAKGSTSMIHRSMLMPPSMPCSVAPSANGEALSHLGVAGYRSLQQLMLPLGPLTLV